MCRGRSEEAYLTLEEEGTVSLLKERTCSLNLVVPFALCCWRMKADVKKHIQLPEKSSFFSEFSCYLLFVASG